MFSSIIVTIGIFGAHPVLVANGADSSSTDRQIFDALKELNNRGADLNNVGDPVGCYRVYQGGLIMLKSLMPQHQAAQKVIDEGLKAAERKPLNERAFALHTTITELRAVFKSAASPPTDKPVPPDGNKAPIPGGELPKPVPLPAPGPPSSFPDK